ncbi:MAG: hypothetical protein RH859_08090 [Longimicrobiales bacterium]
MAAGVVTVLGFTVLHQLLISDIWFSVVPMSVAGAACGASLAWSYTLQFRPATVSTWWGFVTMHTVLLLGLGGVSVALFDPVVPMAALVAANEPPSELIGQAMPLTLAFIVAVAAIPSLLWGRTLPKLVANTVTSALLILLLGLNVSVLGLVDMSSGSPLVVLEFLALLVVIMIGYGTAFYLIERRRFFAGGPGPESAPRHR